MSDIWPMRPLILLVVAVHMPISNLTNYYYYYYDCGYDYLVLVDVNQKIESALLEDTYYFWLGFLIGTDKIEWVNGQ
jgi:hypothetical protein